MIGVYSKKTLLAYLMGHNKSFHTIDFKNGGDALVNFDKIINNFDLSAKGSGGIHQCFF